MQSVKKVFEENEEKFVGEENKHFGKIYENLQKFLAEIESVHKQQISDVEKKEKLDKILHKRKELVQELSDVIKNIEKEKEIHKGEDVKTKVKAKRWKPLQENYSKKSGNGAAAEAESKTVDSIANKLLERSGGACPRTSEVKQDDQHFQLFHSLVVFEKISAVFRGIFASQKESEKPGQNVLSLKAIHNIIEQLTAVVSASSKQTTVGAVNKRIGGTKTLKGSQNGKNELKGNENGILSSFGGISRNWARCAKTVLIFALSASAGHASDVALGGLNNLEQLSQQAIIGTHRENIPQPKFVVI